MKEINIPKKNIIIFITLLLTTIFIIFACNHMKLKISNGELQILDIANNDVSKQYSPLLIKHYQKLHPVYEQPSEPIRIHAAIPFQNGALLLISSFDTKGNPQLVYLEERKILATAHNSVTTFNYTSLMDHTIYYGLMYPGYDNKEITRDFSYGIDASFTNGETKSHECAPVSYTKTSTDGNTAPNGAYAGGYIFVNEGLAWLDEVTYYDSGGNIDIDTTGIINSPYYKWIVEKSKDVYEIEDNRKYFEAERADIEGTVERLDLNPLMMETAYMPFIYSDYEEELTTHTVLYVEMQAAICSLQQYWINENFDVHFMWMQRDALKDIVYKSLEANTRVKYIIIDTSKTKDNISSGELVDVVENGDAYWLNLSQLHNSDKDLKSSFIKSNRVPAEEGIYCLYIDYDGWYHTAVVQVVE